MPRCHSTETYDNFISSYQIVPGRCRGGSFGTYKWLSEINGLWESSWDAEAIWSKDMLKWWGPSTNEQMVAETPMNWHEGIHAQPIEWTNDNESMNQWTNESVNQWSNEAMDQWISESVNQWTNQRVNSESMSQWIHEWINASLLMIQCIIACLGCEWVSRWINQCFNESTNQYNKI
jgi:hypothetical protein